MSITTSFTSIAEQRILEAMEEGKFDNIEGLGKPMPKDNGPYMPDEYKMAYKILKNAGCVPKELEANVEIRSIEQMLNDSDDLSFKLKAIKKLKFLKQKLLSNNNYTKIFDIPENYEVHIVEKLENKPVSEKK